MDYRITEILEAIENVFPESPNLKELALSENISVSYLQHLFKQERGISIKQHVKNMRFEQARVLLETTNLRIKEVCFEVRAPDNAHFGAEFKKAFGFYPKQYRIDFRQNNTNNR